jgi:hypothetical protein
MQISFENKIIIKKREDIVLLFGKGADLDND